MESKIHFSLLLFPSKITHSYIIWGYPFRECNILFHFICNFFYWRIVELQYCISIQQSDLVISFSDYFTLCIILRYWIKFPMLYKKSLLFYLYFYVLIFFSTFDLLNRKFYKNNDCTYFLCLIIPEITMVYITHVWLCATP